MGRKRSKRRTHAGVNDQSRSIRQKANDPKSMVIRIGASEIGSSISQLALDVRRVMEPGTASKLKERKSNKLRDYTTMCGPLGVTHLLLFSRSEAGNTNLRMALTPRGPTLNFRVESYSLSKDVQRAQKRPKGSGKEYATPPLVRMIPTISILLRKLTLAQLVMNNFNAPADTKSRVPKHLESLTTTVFQSLFPPIDPQAAPLSTIRRVLLLNRETADDGDDGFVLNFRHYAITTKEMGMSKPLKRLKLAEKLQRTSKGRKGGLPNLGNYDDIAEFLIGGENGEGYATDGATSGSELESDAEVEVLKQSQRKVFLEHESKTKKPQEPIVEDTPGRVERRAIKLVELGPRMRLRLIKVEEGLAQGEIMWHDHVRKSKTEVKELSAKWETRKKEKEARRKQQKENVERKKAAQAQKAETDDGGDGEDANVADDDDVEFYDSDLFEDDVDMGNVEDADEVEA
jgi:ribosome biogenesis protein SSF1/2